jgi:hypothetical protein
MATLFFVSELICLSRQLTDAFSLPPTNHFANGGFQSSTLSHSLNHFRDFAWSAQNSSEFSHACFLILSSFFPYKINLIF